MSFIRNAVLSNLASFSRFSRCILKPNMHCRITGQRSIFSEERLGIENYNRLRTEFANKLGHKRDEFMAQTKKYLELRVPLVHAADLKAMLHLAQTDQECELLTTMIKIHSKRQTDITLGTFAYGPVVMRYLYIRRDWQRAFDLLMDPNLADFFDQISSLKILMQLLYVAERYDEVHTVMAHSMRIQLNGVKYNNDCLQIATAACLKQNTEESFQIVWEYLNGAHKSLHSSLTGKLPQRAVLQAAFLALKHNKATFARDILNFMPPSNQDKKTRQQALDNVLLLHYAKSMNITDGLFLLNLIVENDASTTLDFKPVFTVFEEVFTEFHEMVMKKGDGDQQHDMKLLDTRMKEGIHLVNLELETFLLRPLISQDRSNIQNKFKQNEYKRKIKFNKHMPGM